MKIAEFRLSGWSAFAAVALMFVFAVGILLPVIGDDSFKSMLDRPMRDITVGQAFGFIVFIWALFK